MTLSADPTATLEVVEREADASLRQLVDELLAATTALEAAHSRAVDLIAARGAGKAWSEIVGEEQRPLLVELLARVLQDLGAAGGRWRRVEANALHSEGMTMDRIAALFGVTRQRVSALLRDS